MSRVTVQSARNSILGFQRDWVATFSCLKLRTLVTGFFARSELENLLREAVVVFPSDRPPSTGNGDTWEIDFKSIRIARGVVGSMLLGKGEDLRETFDFLRILPGCFRLARWIFQAIAHRTLCSGFAPRPTTMLSMGNPPTFSMDPSLPLSTSDITWAVTRAVVARADLARDLSEVTLDGNRYCIPIASNFTLFDSFTVDLVDERTSFSGLPHPDRRTEDRIRATSSSARS